MEVPPGTSRGSFPHRPEHGEEPRRTARLQLKILRCNQDDEGGGRNLDRRRMDQLFWISSIL